MLKLKKKDEMINKDLKDLEALIFPMLMASSDETERKKQIFALIKEDGESIARLIYADFEDDAPFMVQLITDIPVIIDYVMGQDNSKPKGKSKTPTVQKIVKR